MKIHFNVRTLADVATILACAAIVKIVFFGSPQVARSRPPAITQVTGVKTTIPNSSAMRGDIAARVVMIEFADFECPFCGTYARELLPSIEKEFIDTGKVRYAYRNLPLTIIHPLARAAAVAALCAGEQQHFWPMHDRLFANQRQLADGDLAQHARQIALDERRFADCLATSHTSMQGDLNEAQRLGINSTPTFLVGLSQPDQTVHVITEIRGTQPLSVFREALTKALRMAS